MRKYGIFIFFALFLVLFSFGAYAEPIWSINSSYTPTNYTPSTQSSFNVTWANIENGSVVYIEQNWMTTITNITMTNTTYGGNIYNYAEVLPAGTYYWKSYANNSLGWNVSDTWTFTISQAANTVYLYLNGIQNNKTYTYPESVNATLTSAGGTVYLYRNGNHTINGTSPQSELILLGNGTYAYKINATGNQNYSDNSTGITYYAFVNKGNPTSFLNLYIDGASANKTIILPSVANISANETAIGDSDFNYTLWRNDTQLVNGSSVWDNSSLDRGIYKFFYNTTGGANWTSGTTNNLYLYITDLNFSENSTYPVSGVSYSSSATYNFSIKLIGNISNITFESNFLNGTQIYTNNTSTSYSNIAINKTGNTYWIVFPALWAGSYQYRWNATDTNNVRVSTDNIAYTINSFLVSPTFTYSSSGPPWTAITSTSVTLICSLSYPVSLVISPCSSQVGTGNSVSCAFTTGSSSGSAIYTCSISPVYNYTGYTSGLLSWAPFQSSSPGSTTPTQNTTGSFTITASSYSVTMEPNTSKIVTLTLSNAFSYDIININLSVSGINSSWYSLDKTLVSRLRHDGGTNATQLTLKVPSDAERKIYAIVFTASGKDFSLNKITRQTTITLTVPSEHAQQNETQGNQTQNETNVTNATANETNITTGSNVNESNNFLTFLTGLLIKPEYFRNIVLFAGLITAGLVFLFRSNITEFLTGSLSGKAQTKKEVSKEKKPLFSSIKDKFSKYRGTRIVIHVKKEEKEKKEKV